MDAAIFDSFHLSWIVELSRTLNRGALPADHYALTERPTLRIDAAAFAFDERPQPKLEPYRPLDVVGVRRADNDQLVAMIKIVSPRDKANANTVHAFVADALEWLHRGIHLLIVDPWPPGPLDPNGIHGAIWQQCQAASAIPLTAEKSLTLASYECGFPGSGDLRAHQEQIDVGDHLPDLPLTLSASLRVVIPLEQTYRASFDQMPRRWREAIEKIES